MLLNAVVKLLWVFTEMRIQNAVGHGQWGVYSALLSFSFLWVLFADMGINQYAVKVLAAHPEALKAKFPFLLSVKLLLSLLYPFIMIAGGCVWGYNREELSLLGWVALILSGMQLGMFFRSNLQAAQQFRLDGWASVLDRLLLLPVIGLLFMSGITLTGFVYARVATLLITVFIIWYWVIKIHGWHRPRWSQEEIKITLKNSFAFATTTLLFSLHDKIDQVMLKELYGNEETGLYAGAYRWLDASSMYLWTVLPIFFAKFAHHSQNISAQNTLLKTGQWIAALPMIALSAFIYFYPELLLFPFSDSSPEEFETLRACLKVLFIAQLISGLYGIFSTILTATGHEKQVNYVIAFNILLNVVLNYLFIPQYGALACAWATVISYLLLVGCFGIYIYLRTPIQLPIRQSRGLLLQAGATFILLYFCRQQDLSWYIAGAIACLVQLPFAWSKYQTAKNDLQ